MSTRLERFQKRKKLQGSITMVETNKSIQDAADKFLNSDFDENKVNATFNATKEFYDMNISQVEIDTFLSEFKEKFNDQMFNKLVNDCKKDIINSIVTPFGLGKVVAAYDKAGGNVDTIHNVRNKDFIDSDGTVYKDGVYATDTAKENYDNRKEYNSKDYHTHKNYKKTNKQAKEDKVNGILTDAFGDKQFKQNETTNLDHTISAKEVSEDSGRILADLDGTTLANESSNLNITTPEFNNFKKAKTMQQTIVDLDKELKTLNNKSALTENDKVRLKKLKKIDAELDREKALNADQKARKEYNQKINKEYYTSAKFAKNVTVKGLDEGAKMGTQQALGLIITEFFTAVFDEIIDIYKNGFSNGFDNDKFFTILKERLKKISIRVSEKWKDVAIAFKDGFISGFISNLVTTVINMFVTTGKRVVRIIREGIFSLFRAVRLLLFPPENMTYEEAMHEAKKLLATGLIVSLGVIAEEYIDLLIKGTAVLEPFADILTSVFVGAITGLSITMVVYYIDKKKNDKDMFNHLVEDTNKKFAQFENTLPSFNYNS